MFLLWVVSGLHANMPRGQTAPGKTLPVSQPYPSRITEFGSVPMSGLTYWDRGSSDPAFAASGIAEHRARRAMDRMKPFFAVDRELGNGWEQGNKSFMRDIM